MPLPASAVPAKTPQSDADCAQAETHWKSVEALNTLAAYEIISGAFKLRLRFARKDENRSDEEVVALGKSLRRGASTIGPFRTSRRRGSISAVVGEAEMRREFFTFQSDRFQAHDFVATGW